MEGLLRFGQDHWTVISEHFWVFAMWAGIWCGIGAAVIAYLKANKMDALAERISLRDDRIAEYERKLAVASPDQAEAKLEALERTISRLQPQVPGPRNADGLYQLGQMVGTVEGAQIAKDEGRVFFQAVRHQGQLNPALPVEFREFVLDLGFPIPDKKGPPAIAGMKIVLIAGVSAKIVGQAKA